MHNAPLVGEEINLDGAALHNVLRAPCLLHFPSKGNEANKGCATPCALSDVGLLIWKWQFYSTIYGNNIGNSTLDYRHMKHSILQSTQSNLGQDLHASMSSPKGKLSIKCPKKDFFLCLFSLDSDLLFAKSRRVNLAQPEPGTLHK